MFRKRHARLAPAGYGWAVLVLALAGLTSAVAARPQPPAPPAVLEFEHDGHSVTGYVVYATRKEDGVRRRIDAGMPAASGSSKLRIVLPALGEGTWQLAVAAYNAAGESERAIANPPEIRIGLGQDKQSPPPQSSAEPDRTAKKAENPDDAAKPSNRAKKGGLRKLWRFIVGDDDQP